MGNTTIEAMKQPTLTIVRGLPGSGKSTLAKKLAHADGAYHVEADMYFIDAMGNYVFDKSELSDAHTWCRDNVEAELKAGSDIFHYAERNESLPRHGT